MRDLEGDLHGEGLSTSPTPELRGSATAPRSALDTAGSLQIRYVECEGDRLKLQTAVQSCNAEVESLSADIQDVNGSELIAERRWR